VIIYGVSFYVKLALLKMLIHIKKRMNAIFNNTT
ncbi:uncharacterized protein METZ01_LOCUS41682, partial [marine metagenome]